MEIINFLRTRLLKKVINSQIWEMYRIYIQVILKFQHFQRRMSEIHYIKNARNQKLTFDMSWTYLNKTITHILPSRIQDTEVEL